MKAITVRGIPDRLAVEIERRAVETGASVSSTVVRMLEERLGTQQKPHRDLDFLVGVWSDEEWEAFEGTLCEQRRIDPELPRKPHYDPVAEGGTSLAHRR